MLTRRCRLPDEPRIGDDYCHPFCLSVDAIETQAAMFELQREILAEMRSLKAAVTELDDTLRRSSGVKLRPGWPAH